MPEQMFHSKSFELQYERLHPTRKGGICQIDSKDCEKIHIGKTKFNL